MGGTRLTLSRLPTRCKACKAKFSDEDRALHRRIHPDCIPAYAEAQQAKAQRKAEKLARMAAKADRALDRQKRQDQQPLRELLAKAQQPFNAYIRARDVDLPCVSCGVVNPEMTTGGQWDAGHFLSRGAHPELRFNEDNCHKQCKSCNAGSGKFANKERTVSQKFEEELRRRIGSERVDFLKGPQPAKKWQRDELIALKAEYVKRLRELKRGAV